MSIRTQLMLPALAAFLALPVSGMATTGMAQTGKPAPAAMPQHQDATKAKPGMGGMMMGPHHALAMAYRDNLVTFTRAVQRQASGAKTIDLDLARPAVVEMRRSFDQMQLHHQAQMSMMGDDMKAKMGDDMKAKMGDDMKHPTSETKKPTMAMMQQMETHVTALKEHLSALESEVNASVPSPKSVSTHTAEILKHCAAMPGMSAKAKPAAAKSHQMQ